MRRQIGLWGAILMLAAGTVSARMKLSDLAEKLLYGDESTRKSAVNAFNNMSAEQQQKLVPDFMVAMSEDDPKTRKIASRILKAMGVKVEDQLPDVKAEAKAKAQKPAVGDPWAEEKKMKQEAGQGKWDDLTKLKSDDAGLYDTLKGEMEKEKSATFLDASQLTSDGESASSPVAAVRESLKDPNPWVRAQAARRLGSIRPAPVEAIPDLIIMMGENIAESRRAAAAALGSFGPLAMKAVPVLTTALSDPDPATRQIAQEALKQVQGRP